MQMETGLKSVGRTHAEKDDTEFWMATLDDFFYVGSGLAAMALVGSLTTTKQRVSVMGGFAFMFLSMSSLIAISTRIVSRSFRSRESKKKKNMVFKVGVGLCSFTISIGIIFSGISLANFFD